MKFKKIALVLLVATLSLSIMTGCGKNEDEVIEETETVETFEVTKNSDIPNIAELSKAEILAMTAEEVKESVEEYLPNYKEIYIIDDDYEMTDDDWLELRDLICIQLYGSALEGVPDEVQEDYSSDPDSIYYAPTVESIEKMSLSDFAVYMNDLSTYYYGDDFLETNGLDFTTMSDEQLMEQKNDLIAMLEEQQANGNNSALIPNGTSTDSTESSDGSEEIETTEEAEGNE